ncbi:MAG TPA: 1-(5-phosphoribosyl)-5-[(5-phosphoribosylamino)methylideneamino] imidazole-4-carboxamide isomerase [Dokdonella sp.]|nr:1-(5-phosphoribosyl)-5-[(5-phosphoribosylamino)methylideneamino] imidazole-4-carboxamide isomerase [Dokdonella sp.]
MKIIPAIDLCDGRVVRLRQGDFAQARTFAHDPAELAARYAHAGADALHLVDLDGARAARPMQLAAIERIAATGLRVQAGGGVRTREDVLRLFDAGVARVVVGSVAVREPGTFADWLHAFGADRLCLAMDLRLGDDGRWRPAVDAWQASADGDYAALLQRFAAAGLRHVLTTDVDHDGMAAGPNLALYRVLAVRWPAFAWIASGGVRDLGDIDALRATGVAACVAGTALLEGSLPLEALSCSRAA